MWGFEAVLLETRFSDFTTLCQLKHFLVLQKLACFFLVISA